LVVDDDITRNWEYIHTHTYTEDNEKWLGISPEPVHPWQFTPPARKGFFFSFFRSCSFFIFVMSSSQTWTMHHPPPSSRCKHSLCGIFISMATPIL
jgi:hypothetical protein